LTDSAACCRGQQECDSRFKSGCPDLGGNEEPTNNIIDSGLFYSIVIHRK
jgi:hypothetical protein